MQPGRTFCPQRPRGFPLCCTAFLLALAAPLLTAAQESDHQTDLQTLKKAGVAPDAKAVLAYFRAQIDRQRDPQLEALRRRLTSAPAEEREKIAAGLTAFGRAALPALRSALPGASPQAKALIEQCIRRIEQQHSAETEAAAARVLAQLQPDGAVGVLLDYLPLAGDPWLEDEVLHSLARLGMRDGKAAPVLLAALDDAAAVRRGAAAFVLGSRGGPAHRARVRKLLADPDADVRTMAVRGLLGKHLAEAHREIRAADEELLRKHGIAVTEEGVLSFLRRRSLSAEDERRVQALVAQLGHPRYGTREKATRLLIEHGPPALPFLKKALTHGEAEVAVRASLSIDEIVNGPGPALPAAAVRIAAGFTPERAIRAILFYLPFAESEQVEEEALASLCLLAVRTPQADPQLAAALKDPAPARRAAAAYVLGKVGTSEECAALPALLRDPDAHVRLHAAQGLLAAQDRRSVPVLIDLLAELPAERTWKVEEVLARLAGGQPPAAPSEKDGRAKLVRAWRDWWLARGAATDLAALSLERSHLGRITICEFDHVNGQPVGRVWECGPDGKQRWELRNLQSPLDACVLPSGRLLVAENNHNRIIEIDKSGTIHWSLNTPGNPVACQRLPNGNTFYAVYNLTAEVTPAKAEVYRFEHGPAFYVFSATKLRNGHILTMTARGTVAEIDPITRKEVRSVELGPSGWCGVELLPNGRLLVAQLGRGVVREVDWSGKTYWERQYQGAFRATRLPNGHTLVVSMTQRKVAEFDRSGNLVREILCEGRPWQARYR